MNPSLLLSEILTDPTGKGYAAHVTAGNDLGIADMLNAKDAAARVFQRVDADLVVGSIDPGDADGLTEVQRNRLFLYLKPEKVDFRLPNVRAAFEGIFLPDSTTAKAILAIAARPASRLEVIAGEGARAYQNHISQALRGF